MQRFTLTLLAGLVLAGIPLQQAGAKPKPKERKHEKHGVRSPSTRRDERLGWERVPPGWSEGKKTGWRGGSVPPGHSGAASSRGGEPGHAGKGRH